MSLTKRFKILALTIGLAATGAVSQAVPLLIGPATADSDYWMSGPTYDTVGYWFTVGNNALLVDQLGVADFGYLFSPNRIGLWTETGTLLADVIVPAGAKDYFDDDRFTWGTLATSVVLSANTKYVLGSFPTEPPYGATTGVFAQIPSGWVSPDVIFGGSARSTNGESEQTFKFPNKTWEYGGEGFFGPNLQYTVIPNSVPDEPLLAGLLLPALAAMLAGRKRLRSR